MFFADSAVRIRDLGDGTTNVGPSASRLLPGGYAPNAYSGAIWAGGGRASTQPISEVSVTAMNTVFLAVTNTPIAVNTQAVNFVLGDTRSIHRRHCGPLVMARAAGRLAARGMSGRQVYTTLAVPPL